MADKKPIIDCWEPGEPDLKEIQDYVCEEIAEAFQLAGTRGLEKWFKTELSEALRVLIVQEGVVDISFGDDDNPRIQFWADGAQYDELTFSEPLAGKIEGLIDDWGSDIDDDEAGPQLRNQLSKLRDVLRAALDKIDITLADARRLAAVRAAGSQSEG